MCFLAAIGLMMLVIAVIKARLKQEAFPPYIHI
jgi:hypothetical protein